MGLVFSRAGDNLLKTATTITVASGTPLTGYGTANLFNATWAHPFKIAETTLDLRIDHGAAVSLGWVILGNSNVDVAASFQRHTADSWGAPDVDLAFGAPVQSVDGLFSSPHLDVSGFAAKQYSRLLITANALPIIIGELALITTRRELSRHYLLADKDWQVHGASVEHVTGAGVDLAYSKAASRDVLDGSILCDDADLAAVEGLFQSTRQGVRPFWMLPRESYADAWFVRWAARSLPKPPLGPTLSRVSLPLRQLSRGLPWVDPDA